MNSMLSAAQTVATQGSSLGQTIFFWVTAPLIVVLALGLLFAKKAMHSAICMVGVMLGLAMMYISLSASFIGVVQVVVYTGAVMTLILFIIMLLGTAASDHYKRTNAALRGIAIALGALAGVGFVATMIFSYLPADGEIPPTQTVDGQTDSNPVQVALSMFQDHVFSVEVVGALLIIAVIGAMTLTHTDKISKIFKQEETAKQRMLEYADRGTHPGQLPAPGVYQQSNAADVPAIDGVTESALETSVSPALRARGTARPLGQASPTTVARIREDKYGDPSKGLQSLEATRSVGYSGAWGMKGTDAPEGLQVPRARKLGPAKKAGSVPSAPAAPSDEDKKEGQE